jgi:hypothetical protein
VKATSPPPHRRVLALAALLGVVAAALVALALPATAMSATCGENVLEDWFDNGRIDRLYDLHCYEDAIDLIPNDLRDYANAEEIISRALQAAVGGKLDPGGPDPSPEANGGGDPGPGSTPPGPGGGNVASPEVDPTGLSSVPIPLIVLGLMSLALLTAGGLGYLRRRHAGDDVEGPDDDLVV